MPIHIANLIEIIQRDILWGDAKKFHLVDWKVVSSPLKEGGLGIWKLSSFNQALLRN